MELTSRESLMPRAATNVRRSTPSGNRLGGRVRQLRVAAGLTQTDLAGDRFSKEYVSQIERGKTRPTRETIDWLAGKLGVDPGFLERGVSADERRRVDTLLARAEALTESHRYEEAIAEYENCKTAVLATGVTELEVRHLAGEAWARMESSELKQAIELLNRARMLAEAPEFSDVDRADLLFRLAVCRYQLSSISTAVNLLNEALSLAEGSELPCDRLRADILARPSRYFRRQRDSEAAREDVECALELAQALDDPRKTADTYFQASLVSERMGHWVQARNYAERAKAHYEQINDERNVGRLLNNTGGLNFHLVKPTQAIENLSAEFSILLDKGSDAEAANVVASLAHVHLMTGEATAAEAEARHALSLMENRDDFLYHVAPTQLVLGRALMEQGRLDEADEFLAASGRSAERLESLSHRAAAWMARGDLAAKRGEDGAAARLYRRAAEALQDVRF